jgi:hypothetical protein
MAVSDCLLRVCKVEPSGLFGRLSLLIDCAEQPGTWVYMRFPSGKVWRRGCTATVVTKHRLLSYPYLKIDIVVFFF